MLSTAQVQQALKLVDQFVATKSILPILANVAIRIHNRKATFSATDLESSIQVQFPVGDVPDVDLTVNYALMKNWLSTKRQPELSLVQTANAASLTMRCGDAQMTLKGIESDDFPRLPSIEPDAPNIADHLKTNAHQNYTRLLSTVLAEAWRSVLYAAALEHTNPILQAVSHVFVRDSATIEAIDGYRLARYRFGLDNPVETETRLNIPRSIIQKILSILPKDEDIQIAFNDSHVLWSWNNVTVATRRLDGLFPDLDRFIPESSHEWNVQKHLIANAVGSLAKLLKQMGTNTMIEMHVDQDAWTFKIRKNEIGDALETIPVEYQSAVPFSPFVVAYNAHYLVDMIQSLPSQTLRILLDTPQKPISLYKPDSDAILGLTMPIRIP